eukprot:8417694-Pyramimonas_sp.AAC.1
MNTLPLMFRHTHAHNQTHSYLGSVMLSGPLILSLTHPQSHLHPRLSRTRGHPQPDHSSSYPLTLGLATRSHRAQATRTQTHSYSRGPEEGTLFVGEGLRVP